MHIKSEFDLYCESQQGCCKEGDDCIACALLWATERASKSKESASTPHNTCVMQLPKLAEVESHVSGDLMLPLLNNSERNIIRSVYEFILSRQRHNT